VRLEGRIKGQIKKEIKGRRQIMKRSRRLGLLLCSSLLATNLSGQETLAEFHQKQLKRLGEDIATHQDQINKDKAEIERIRRTYENENLVEPDTTTVPVRAAAIPGPLDKLSGILKLRQTLQDPSLADLPAKVSYLHPDKGGDTIAVDVGLDLNILKALTLILPKETAQTEVNPIRVATLLDALMEYHRSTSATSPVDTLLAGVQVQRNLGNIGNWGNWLNASTTYKGDNLVSGDGLLADISYYPSYPFGDYPYTEWPADGSSSSRFGIYTISRLTLGSWKLDYLIKPNVGFQFETGNGASSKFTSGDRVSLKGALNLTLYPFPTTPTLNGLQWSNTINYWSHLSTTGGFDQYDRNQYFFQSSLNFYFDQAKQVAVGVDYTYGDNLTINQFDTNTWTISFKAKLGK
jgi:hypothetical protein